MQMLMFIVRTLKIHAYIVSLVIALSSFGVQRFKLSEHRFTQFSQLLGSLHDHSTETWHRGDCILISSEFTCCKGVLMLVSFALLVVDLWLKITCYIMKLFYDTFFTGHLTSWLFLYLATVLYTKGHCILIDSELTFCKGSLMFVSFALLVVELWLKIAS